VKICHRRRETQNFHIVVCMGSISRCLMLKNSASIQLLLRPRDSHPRTTIRLREHALRAPSKDSDWRIRWSDSWIIRPQICCIVDRFISRKTEKERWQLGNGGTLQDSVKPFNEWTVSRSPITTYDWGN